MAEPHRLYSEQPIEQSGETVVLGRDESHHGLHVLRLRRGDEVWVFDADGRQFAATVENTGRKQMTVRLGRPVAPAPEPPVPLSLYLALAKGPAFDHVLMRAVELGAAEIVPFAAGRSVARVGGDCANKIRRWQQILLAATKQCGRARLTAIGMPVAFEEAVRRPAESALRLCCAPAKTASKLSVALQEADCSSAAAIAVMIGPEGGLTDSEVALAARHGWKPVSLGPRTLRVETAATAALTMALAFLGEL
ncbi:MAG: 16S rRNA (uracil(1498)-N(3))-methyltransferase [Candidatus Sumerlaeia bacterium]|nr:16S rRNA (uracil(1498)-N(3))-methyltransferase [Candidatus Sumerlaeia bacterium]